MLVPTVTDCRTERGAWRRRNGPCAHIAALNAQHVQLASDIAEGEIGPRHDIYCSGLPHVCLQTSCWVVQLRVQGELPAGFRVPVGDPTTTQAFWQFMACVSQVPEQAVDICDDINGVGVSGTGWTSPGVTICPGTACASRIRSSARAVECQMQRPELRVAGRTSSKASVCAKRNPNPNQHKPKNGTVSPY
jgi:hypothetical protein